MHPFRRVNPIRFTTTMLIAVCLGSTATAQNDLAFEPYPVFVIEKDGHARCGPSEEYYRTDPLRHGQELEVFAETDDGWLGIRPPNDSFCWIPAETVEMDSSEDAGIVIEDRTVAWIGTHLGRARSYRWQVQLAKGEPVTVIGRSEREGPDGPQLWYRIVPPSGEYRWVHRDQVVRSSEELVAMVRSESADSQPTRNQPKNSVAKKSKAKLGDPIALSSTKPDSFSKTASSRRRTEPRGVVESSGPSVLDREETVGSGLDENWKASEATPSQNTTAAVEASAPQPPRTAPAAPVAEATASNAPPQNLTDAMKQGGLLASVEFLSRPRLLEIGGAPSAPGPAETAGDGNWVSGAARGVTQTAGSAVATTNANPTAAPTPTGTIMQVSAQQPIGQPLSQRTKVVPAERVAQIESETANAGVERLTLILSRLMAAQASEAEAAPVARAARQLANSSTNTVEAGRARLLAERAEQYQRVALRRDGQSIIHGTIAPATANMNQTIQATVTTAAYSQPQVQQPPQAGASTQTGYLVQVYSARSGSPPFALTDNSGRTLAYVTPLPGVNLRVHLNSRISVSGNPGFLTGLNTPHILATQAVRTPE